MPGPFVHMSVMRHAARELADGAYRPVASQRIDPGWTGPDPAALGRLLQRGTGRPNFAAVGALGPDLFVFLPDFRDNHGIPVSSILIQILRFLEGVYDALDPYVSKYEKYLGPISEDTAEEMSRLTGGLSEIVGDITGDLSAIVTTALENLITQQADWWSFFSLGMNQGFDDQAYFWSDMGHYRRTGDFCRALWRAANAAENDDVRSYALGYTTHIATDVTGHAFVNAISGGPYRLHWQRHHLVENHMESDWYRQDPLRPGAGSQYPQWTESALYYDIAFDEEDGGPVERPTYPTGNTLRENWTRKRLLDIDSALPDSIANVLLAAIDEVFYQGGPHPKILHENDGRPTVEILKDAYDLFFRYLKLTTVDGFSHEPPPPPDVFPNLDFPTMNDAQDGPPGDGGGGGDDGGSFWDDLLDFILSAINVIAWLVEVAVYLATLPWAVLADLVTYPLRLGLYYAFELPLFHILKTFRAVLVMTGYASPMEDEIAMGLTHVGMPDATTYHEVIGDVLDLFGGLDAQPPKTSDTTWRDRRYPHYHPDDEFHHPWQYPTSHAEWMYPSPAEVATAAPFAAGAGVDTLFNGLDATPEIRDRLEASTTPQETDAVGRDVTPSRNLGSSVSFAKYMIWLATRDPDQDQRENKRRVPLVQWNLDADRGYGYHGWDWNRNAAAAPVLDPEGNPYQPPCTWPQQSDTGWNENLLLQLHYVDPGLEDPGCLGPPDVILRDVPAEASDTRRTSRRVPRSQGPAPRRAGRRERRDDT